MGKKRKHNAVKSDQIDSSKRVRLAENGAAQQTDENTGQKYVFGGLEDEGSDSADEVSREALAYLKSVRSEALGIPTVLVGGATKATRTYDEDIENYDSDYSEKQEESRNGGYYKDGAYIAAPVFGPQRPTIEAGIDERGHDSNEKDGSERVPAAEAYHTTLINRFRVTQSKLRLEPPNDVVAALDVKKHPIRVVIGSVWPMDKGAQKWQSRIFNGMPHSAQVASMSSEAVMQLIDVATQSLTIEKMVSRQDIWEDGHTYHVWVWSLLGRLDDVDTMNSSEVSNVRQLGKAAAQVTLGLWQNEEGGLSESSPSQSPEREEEHLDDEMDSALILERNEENVGEMRGEDTAEEVDMVEEMEVVEESETLAKANATASARSDSGRRNSSSSISSGFLEEAPSSSANFKMEEEKSPRLDGESLEEARSRLLAQLEATEANGEQEETDGNNDEGEEEIVYDSIGMGTADATDRQAEKKQGWLATLDMILTVVGDCYGQRDLLGARDLLWDMMGEDEAEE